jgi:hypothetical protein
MAPSGQGVWAPLVARGPSIVRRLRLASGLVMFSYVFLHFLNHSLGNFGYEAMEAGAQYAEMIWRGPIGGPLLYGAFAIHFSLAFWALYIRRHLRMGWLEAVRLLLGFLIPALIVQHAVGHAVRYPPGLSQCTVQYVCFQPLGGRQANPGLHNRLAARVHGLAFVAAS